MDYRLPTCSQPSFLNTQFYDLFRSYLLREIDNNLAASSVRSTHPLVLSILWADHIPVCHTTGEYQMTTQSQIERPPRCKLQT